MIRAGNPGTTVSLVEVETAGDRDPVGPIAQLTEVGAFVRAVQAAVRDDRADLAVHSLKDLPVVGPDDLVLAAFPERASPLDVMVGSSLNDLPTVQSSGPEALVGARSSPGCARICRPPSSGATSRPVFGRFSTARWTQRSWPRRGWRAWAGRTRSSSVSIPGKWSPPRAREPWRSRPAPAAPPQGWRRRSTTLRSAHFSLPSGPCWLRRGRVVGQPLAPSPP